MHTITESAEITKEDIQALRTATSVSFHTNDKGSKIRASFDDRNGATRRQSEIFPERDGGDRFREIRISYEAYENFYAFSMVHTAQYSRTFNSIARILRAGNRLAFRWGKDANTTDNLRNAGLHGDQFDIVISTGLTDRDPKVFTVETSACPDNTARMIRNTVGW